MDINAEETHRETYGKTKKFVFQIDAENIDFVEGLSYQEKQEIINQLLYDYQNNQTQNYNVELEKVKIKRLITVGLLIIIGVPLMFTLLNLSWQASHNNNMNMQSNFQKLYHE